MGEIGSGKGIGTTSLGHLLIRWICQRTCIPLTTLAPLWSYLQSLKSAEPSHSLKKSRILGPDLNRVSVVDTHTKPMRHSTVQRRLVRGADVQQQSLQVRPEVRRHESVTICQHMSAHTAVVFTITL